jgi:hypothetical protein
MRQQRARSAEGEVGHAVGGDIEALQGRKAEKQIGHAGNDDRRPYANGDMKMDLAKFQPVEPANTVANGRAEDVASLSAKLQLGSDPPGADIDVDGSFVETHLPMFKLRRANIQLR